MLVLKVHKVPKGLKVPIQVHKVHKVLRGR